MISIFGISIHEFSVALSDLLLCIESAIFAYVLYRTTKEKVNLKNIQGLGFFLFFFLSMSSIFGAIFHAFFPEKTASWGGLLIWILTAISIGLVASVVWYLDAFLLENKKIYKIVNYFVAFFLAAYTFTILFVDYHYPTIIKFYAPPILLLGLIALWCSIITRKSAWVYLLVGIGLSGLAAGVQFLHINLDPIYFNFNTLYHLIQGTALFFMFVSLSKLPRTPI